MEQAQLLEGLEISEIHLDALREISNIGMGHAATALNQMLGKPIHLSIPEASIVALAEVPELIGGAEQVVAGIYIKIWGDIRGNILLVIPKKSVFSLCAMLTGNRPPEESELSEMNSSALLEIGNIVVSSYLSALERLLGRTLFPSVPSLAFDMVGAVVDYILIQLGEEADKTMVVKTAFSGEEGKIHGHFFLLPDPESLKLILQAASVLAEDSR